LRGKKKEKKGAWGGPSLFSACVSAWRWGVTGKVNVKKGKRPARLGEGRRIKKEGGAVSAGLNLHQFFYVASKTKGKKKT